MNKSKEKRKWFKGGKRSVAIVTTIALLGSMLPFSVSAQPSNTFELDGAIQVLYENDFSGADPLSGWQFRDQVKAEIVTEDNNQVFHFSGNSAEGGNGYAVAYYPGNEWKNYTIEADIKVNGYLNSGQGYDGFGMKAAAGHMDSFFSGAYYRSQQTPTKFQFMRSGSGSLGSDVTYTIEEGKYYTCKLEVENTRTAFYIKEKDNGNYGEPLLNYTGTQEMGTNGGISFEATFTDLYIDNLVVTAIEPPPMGVYVADNGSDEEGDGTFQKPYQTIAKARDVVSEKIAAGLTEDLTVYIRGGVYYLDEEILLDEDDFDENYTVTYQNYNDEKVRILGGKPVTGWSDSAGDGIYEADVTGRHDFYALVADGERRTAAKETNWKGISVKDISHMQAVYGGPTNWFGEVLKVKTFDGNNLTTNYAPGNMSGGLWFLQGAKEYIDEPGEWAVEGNTVYYKPLDGTDPSDNEVIAPKAERIFYLKGTEETPIKNIVIDGLSLEMNAFGEDLRAHANGNVTAEHQSNLKGIVDLDNTTDITVKNCSITGGGYMAVMLNHYSQNNMVYGNYIEDTGYAGLFLIGENPGSLNYINKNNTISNNEIKNVGKFVGHGSGIYLINSGENTITHNNISGLNRYGISMKGIRYGVFADNGVTGVPFEDHYQYNQTTGNYIGYNVIYNTGMYSADGGGVEGWGIGRDNWIDHNIIYNAYRGVATTGWRGHSIFTDDATHHTMVTNTIIYDEDAVAAHAGTMMKSIDN